jgi:hypothetical protein
MPTKGYDQRVTGAIYTNWFRSIVTLIHNVSVVIFFVMGFVRADENLDHAKI